MDKEGKVRSTEVPIDLVQDLARHIVVVGFDVEQLYPSLEMGMAAKLVEETIWESTIKWKDLEYFQKVWFS